MREHERIRRPKPERTQPIRGDTFSLFGAPDATSFGEARSEGGAPEDPVSVAVGLGYRVVDDYIRQGQNAARLMARRSYGPEAFANDMQDLTARAMQYGAEFMDLWMQLLGQAAVGQATRPASAAAAPGRESGEPRAGSRMGSRLVVAIDSLQPAEVSVDLDAPSGRPLVVQELQDPRGGPSIPGAVLEAIDPPRLRVHVPPGQTPGTYSGLVLDAETSLPAGNVVVRVLPSQARSEGEA